MRTLILIFLQALLVLHLQAQNKTPADYGFRHLQTLFKGDTIDILILSKKGEENKQKPLFLFIQGSQPHPLIITYEKGIYQVFPFKTDSILTDYHMAIISKPHIPLIVDIRQLDNSTSYTDSITGNHPKEYVDRNYLDYYVNRDKKAITFLKKQPFIDKKKIVIAGHSEGSTIAAKLATVSKDVTHLIYASGNPMGRISSIIAQLRASETIKDETTEQLFERWHQVVNDPENKSPVYGDPNKTLYTFSEPAINYLEQLKIPVLISYGTKDYSVNFNDYLRIDIIRKKKTNFTFTSYIGLEHNFFELKKDGGVNYDTYNWDDVGLDWLQWLRKY